MLFIHNNMVEQVLSMKDCIDIQEAGFKALETGDAIGLLRKAPHPHAAMLFYDFMLSDEAQQILSNRYLVPTSNKIDTPWKRLSLTFIDPVLSLDLNEKWIKVYEEAVTKRTKQ